MNVKRFGTVVPAAMALALAMSGTVLGGRPAVIVAINNANAWFIVHDPNEPCEFDQITLTVAQDYAKAPGNGESPGFNTWADVSFGHWSGCEDPALVAGTDMYGAAQLEADVSAAVNELDSAWVDTPITVVGGGASRTFTFDLSWAATGSPATLVDSGNTGSTGRYVVANLSGSVGDSDGVFTMDALDRAELSVVHHRIP